MLFIRRFCWFAVVAVSGISCAWLLGMTSTVQAADYFVPQTIDSLMDINLSETRFNNYKASTVLYVYEYDNSRSMGSTELFKEWYREIYYHFIVQGQFTDLPFNYIIDESGQIWKGKQGTYDVQPDIVAGENDPGSVLVWVPKYTSKQSVIQQDLQSLVNLYQITKASLFTYTVEKGTVSSPSKLKLATAVPYLGLTLSQGDLSQRHYDVSVEKVDYPAQSNQGVDFEVTVTLKNKSEFPLYNKNNVGFFLATCNPKDKNSRFSETETWSSQSRVSGFEKAQILPQETFTITFKMSNPLKSGKYSEIFCPLIQPNGWITSSKFTVSFLSKSTGYNLRRVTTGGFEYINARSMPWYSADAKFRLVEGDTVVFVKQQAEWVYIKTKSGKEGWVINKYLRSL